MKKIFAYPIVTFLGGMALLFSCKKSQPSDLNASAFDSPPQSHAGPDIAIQLPQDSAFLDGKSSKDQDGKIIEYQWTKISGPDSFRIKDAKASATTVGSLVMGTYRFELKVTDNEGLSGRDTVTIFVSTGPPSSAGAMTCGATSRPVVNATLVAIGTLAHEGAFIPVAAGGTKIFFAGGQTQEGPPYVLSVVNIYDVVSGEWTTAQFSQARGQLATVTAGNKVFFAGGAWYDEGGDAHPSKLVDIFDLTTNTWTVDSLSEPRYDLAAAAVGNKVLFAGGIKSDLTSDFNSDRVDIYDLSSRSWSRAALSQARSSLAGVAVNGKVYFGGGFRGFNIASDGNTEYLTSDRIDIYDDVTSSWSTSSLDEPKEDVAAVAVGSKIFWAGGDGDRWGNATSYNWKTCKVEIMDVNTASNSASFLFEPEAFITDRGENAVVKDNKIVFFTGTYTSDGDTRFNIYDIASNSWSVGVIPVSLSYTSIIALNNTIFLAGGYVNGNFTNESNQVWRLEF